MGADCKSVDLVCVGSNPTRPSFNCLLVLCLVLSKACSQGYVWEQALDNTKHLSLSHGICKSKEGLWGKHPMI